MHHEDPLVSLQRSQVNTERLHNSDEFLYLDAFGMPRIVRGNEWLTSLALLIFQMDEIDQTVSSLKSLGPYFDEAVIIDSSSHDNYAKLIEMVGPSAKVYHIPAIGYPDPLRLYALSKIKSEYVLHLDGDESASKVLLENLRNLDKFDGYFIPRIEDGYSRTSFHLRLFRKEKYQFKGYIHENPQINGKIRNLPPSYSLVHHVKRHHLTERMSNYLEIELFERPEPATVSSLLAGKTSSALSPVVVPAYLSRDLLLAYRNATGWCYPIGESLRYMVDKYFHVYSQSEDRLKLAIAVSREMRTTGGPIKYLSFDDPSIVESLEEYSNRRKIRGFKLFIDLLVRRYQTGSIKNALLS